MKNENQPDNFETLVYTVKDIAGKLNISERSAYNFCNNTTDFEVKRIGRLIRIKKESFDRWWNKESDISGC